jgi:hypothetical protein
VLDAIEQSERRKSRVRAVEREAEEVSQMWWKEVVSCVLCAATSPVPSVD